MKVEPLATVVRSSGEACCDTVTSFSRETTTNQEHPCACSSQEGSLLHNRSEIECPFCFSTVPPGDALILHGCGHAFCLECFKLYVNVRVGEGYAAKIICPMPVNKCGKYVQQNELREVLGKEAYRKLERHALQSAIDADPTLHHCPTPDCPHVVRWTYGEPPRLSCPICKKSSCLHCKISPFHEGMTCAQYNMDKHRRAKKRLLLFVWSLGWKKVHHAKEKEVKQTANYMKNQTRVCKKCGAQIIKESGCDKVKCRCGYRFCFVCGSENAQCYHTPKSHGYVDNVTGRADFRSLNSSLSPNS